MCREGVRRVSDAVGGSNPPFGINSSEHKQYTDDTQTLQKSTRAGVSSSPSEHQNDTFLHEKYVICVSEISDDLATVVHAWDKLPEAVKAGILAMVNAAR